LLRAEHLVVNFGGHGRTVSAVADVIDGERRRSAWWASRLRSRPRLPSCSLAHGGKVMFSGMT
jgi:hypothetical protein